MVYNEDLLAALEALGQHRIEAKVSRVTFESQLPLRPNVRGARWNPPDLSAIYTSVEEATARAEFSYNINAQAVRPNGRVTIHEIDVRLGTVEINAEWLRDHGVDLRALPEGLEGQAPCREVGGAVAFLGADGLLVPSLRRTSGTNLVVFPDNFNPGSNCEVSASATFELDEVVSR